MRKEVTAKFILDEKEIKEAIYELFVRKMKQNNISCTFTSKDVVLYGYGEDTVTITSAEIEISENKNDL